LPAREAESRADRVRYAGSGVRADVRVVDEVSRLDDGRFVALLPQTPKAGGEVVCKRLAKGTVAVLGAREESVAVRLLAAPQDEAAIAAFIRGIAPHEPPDQASGAYRSEGASTRNPAADSTPSAR